jgi:outer membrane receptor protein involved in Fe transport
MSRATWPTTFLDGSASYKLSDQLSFSVDALNLTNEKDISYIDSKVLNLIGGLPLTRTPLAAKPTVR